MSVYEFALQAPGFADAAPKLLSQTAARLQIPPELFYDDRPLGSLSGGEKVKLRLALLTLRRADLWLLDEPSNDLDIPTLAWLEGFLLQCREPVLYISHDETLLERTATGVLHLEQLRRKTLPRWTLSRVGYREYADRRASSFAHQEQVARKEREEDRKKQDRLREIAQKVEHQQAAISRQDPHGGRLLKKKMKAVKSTEHRYEREREDMTEMPEEEEAIQVFFSPSVALPAGKTVLEGLAILRLLAAENGPILARNIRLSLRGAEHVGIIGHNGAGKSTLLRQIARELLGRQDIRAFYMPQDYAEALDLSRTPVDILTGGSGKKEEVTRAKTLLGSMKVTAEECEHSAQRLSGGQKAKILFLRMILEEANVLILDEPTRNFSPLSGPVIRGMLRDFPGCIVSVSHDRKFLREVCTRVLRLEEEGLAEVRSEELGVRS